MLALKSLMGKTNPVGAPFAAALCENEYWVFAIQIGKPENPCLVYISICFSAWSHEENLSRDEANWADFKILAFGILINARESTC